MLLTAAHDKLLGYLMSVLGRWHDAPRSHLKFDDDLLATLASERLVDLDLQGGRIAALELCLNEVGPAERELLRAAYAEHGGIIELAARLQRAPRTLYNKLTLLRRRLTECVQRRLQEGGV